MEKRDPQTALFERFLELPTGKVDLALSGAADLLSEALGADKVDAFVHDVPRASLTALGTSQQPLSALQKSAGLDVLPIANGGRAVEVFVSGRPFLSGSLRRDDKELLGIREVLRVQSQIAVPIDIGGRRHGVLGIASLQENRWGDEDLRFAQGAARWVGIVAHRAQLLADLEREAIEAGRRAAANELVTTVAHDLRNYLNPLELRVDGIGRRARRDNRLEDIKDAQLALRSLTRISDFITDLLDVARIDHGIFALAPRPIDLCDLAAEVASTMSTASQPIEVKVAEPTVAVVDPSRLRQCLENLIANARKHCPEGLASSWSGANGVRPASGRAST